MPLAWKDHTSEGEPLSDWKLGHQKGSTTLDPTQVRIITEQGLALTKIKVQPVALPCKGTESVTLSDLRSPASGPT